MIDRTSRTEHKRGFHKIISVSKQSRYEGLDWAWVDTCCIDKSSSAELSEAINSMYRYYQRASCCYVYLEDVEAIFHSTDQGQPWYESHVSQSRWWSRGWTLQELIAPAQLSFYDMNWSFIASKATRQCRAMIQRLTGIPDDVLAGQSPFACSIAQRLSWAASRHTTREEDIAYCLLGILNINMPLLYGEGSQAFIRLQEEVIKRSADQSMFVWDLHPGNGYHAVSRMTGVLAESPAVFSRCRDVKAIMAGEHSYAMTNLGLNITLPMRQIVTAAGCLHIALLADGNDGRKHKFLCLKRLYANRYARLHAAEEVSIAAATSSSAFAEMTVNIVQNLDTTTIANVGNAFGILYRILFSADQPLHRRANVYCADYLRSALVASQVATHQDSINLRVAPFPYPIPATDMPWAAIALKTQSREFNMRETILFEFGIQRVVSQEDEMEEQRPWVRSSSHLEIEVNPEHEPDLKSVKTQYYPLDAIPNQVEDGEIRQLDLERYLLPSRQKCFVSLAGGIVKDELGFQWSCRPELIDSRLFVVVDVYGKLD